MMMPGNKCDWVIEKHDITTCWYLSSFTWGWRGWWCQIWKKLSKASFFRWVPASVSRMFTQCRLNNFSNTHYIMVNSPIWLVSEVIRSSIYTGGCHSDDSWDHTPSWKHWESHVHTGEVKGHGLRSLHPERRLNFFHVAADLELCSLSSRHECDQYDCLQLINNSFTTGTIRRLMLAWTTVFMASSIWGHTPNYTGLKVLIKWKKVSNKSEKFRFLVKQFMGLNREQFHSLVCQRWNHGIYLVMSCVCSLRVLKVSLETNRRSWLADKSAWGQGPLVHSADRVFLL